MRDGTSEVRGQNLYILWLIHGYYVITFDVKLWIDLQLIFFGKQVVISFISYRNQNWPKSKNICKHYLLYEYKFQVFIVEI